ncbi:MAG TPA: DNA polymerase Y family protein, partial [Burkholderiales bacterium]|nr:DNA polymerase Y family protein [Burkholderiales bacterium]
MLWLAINFPALSLEVFPASKGPMAVAEKRIALCNQEASNCGVTPGMPISAALAMSSGLIVKSRDRNAERETLMGLAAWAGSFTPSVSIQPSGLLLEIGSCIRLHNGLANLLSKIRENLHEMGCGFHIACAPTPHAAWLLAISGTEIFVMQSGEIGKAIGRLPVRLLSQPSKVIEGLEMVGAKMIGDCMRLPRSGMAKRFGQAVHEEIDRALGRIPDPRICFVPPPVFERRLQLPASVLEAEGLLFALKRILPELSGHLSLRQSGIQEVELHCMHEEAKDTRLKIGFSRPTRSHEKMLLLFREILNGTALPSPVQEILVRAENILPLEAHNADLFDDEEKDDGLLIERL